MAEKKKATKGKGKLELDKNIEFLNNSDSILERLAKNSGVDLEKLKTLTERELRYFRIMSARHGVLYLKAKPGVAKSGIAKSIAEKLGALYLDIRLAMVDETDVGLYPSIVELDVTATDMVTGEVKKDKLGKTEIKSQRFLDHVIPKWAFLANQQLTIIHFEELNRAPLAVRNAAMQILLDRAIGVEFKFNENVYMMASGNLGEEDGTEVEEFDFALKNRLITIEHHIDPLTEWVTWATGRIHPDIISYIKARPEMAYQSGEDTADAFATYRSWHFLSDLLKQMSDIERDENGAEVKVKWITGLEYVPAIQEDIVGYLGNTSINFLSWIQDNIRLNIKDVIERYPEIAEQLAMYDTSKEAELVENLKKFNPKNFTAEQETNVKAFINSISEELRTAYVLWAFDSSDVDTTDKKVKAFFMEWRDLVVKIKQIGSTGTN